jgi:hypothetical protein
VVEPTSGPPSALWLVCRATGDDPVPVQLAIDSNDLRADAAARGQVEQVVAGLQHLAEAHGLEVLEDPRLQLEAHGHQRSADPVVQRAVAAAHADGRGTYRQLADQFGLADGEEVRHAVRAGKVLLAGEPPDRPTRGSSDGGSPPPRPDGPSAAQRRKFSKFQTEPVGDAALDAFRRYAELVGLDLQALGDTWGVTVCVDAGTVLRVNVGPRVTLDVLSKGPVTRVFAIGDPPDTGGAMGVRVGRGFEQVPGSYSLVFPLSEPSTLGLPGLQSGMRAFVELQARRIVPTFHNPLMTPVVRELLRGDPRSGSVLGQVEQYRSRYGPRPETFEAYVDVFDNVPGAGDFPGGWTTFSRAANAEPAMDEELVRGAEELMAAGGYEPAPKEPGKGRRWFKRP